MNKTRYKIRAISILSLFLLLLAVPYSGKAQGVLGDFLKGFAQGVQKQQSIQQQQQNNVSYERQNEVTDPNVEKVWRKNLDNGYSEHTIYRNGMQKTETKFQCSICCGTGRCSSCNGTGKRYMTVPLPNPYSRGFIQGQRQIQCSCIRGECRHCQGKGYREYLSYIYPDGSWARYDNGNWEKGGTGGSIAQSLPVMEKSDKTEEKPYRSQTCTRCHGTGIHEIRSIPNLTAGSEKDKIESSIGMELRKCPDCGKMYKYWIGHSCTCTSCKGKGYIEY